MTTRVRLVVKSYEWRGSALCARPENRNLMWFPKDPEWQGLGWRRERDELLKVRKVCAECPVWAECRDFADRHHVSAGIWAGEDYWIRPV